MADPLAEAVLGLVRGEAPCLYLRLDAEERVAEANSHAIDLLGDGLIGARFGDLLVDFERSLSAAALARAQPEGRLVTFRGRGPAPLTKRCVFRTLGDGTLVLGGADPRASARVQASLLALTADLSNQARALQQAKAELARLGQLKDQFLGMAAHDLRSPILGVLSFAEYLEEDLSPTLEEEQRQQLELIRASAEMMRHLVDGFLDVALIESGHLRIDQSPARLADVVRHALKLVELGARRKGVALRVSCADPLPSIPLDADRFAQVVINLATNAVQHSFPGGAVELSTGGDQEGQWLRVQDHGTGMPPEVQRDLFTAFAGGAGHKTAGERSVGLGLAISRLIVEAHGGAIEVVSAPGEGTCFTVWLSTASPAPASR